MPLTKEQLLIPRVMCVGGPKDTNGDDHYPGSEFKVGDILVKKQYGNRQVYELSGEDKENRSIHYSTVENFPHLFRLMPWWEGRQPEDMPDWVRYIEYEYFYKISEWVDDGEGCLFFTFKIENADDGELYPNGFTPATEQEYIDYQKQKEG